MTSTIQDDLEILTGQPPLPEEETKTESILAHRKKRVMTVPKSEKQLAALVQNRQKMLDNAKLRREEDAIIKAQEDEAKRIKQEKEKEILEARLVKKAILVKKRELAKQKIIDEVLNEETEPIQREKIVAKKAQVKPVTAPIVVPPAMSFIKIR